VRCSADSRLISGIISHVWLSKKFILYPSRSAIPLGGLFFEWPMRGLND
jgi:hypothetical protein